MAEVVAAIIAETAHLIFNLLKLMWLTKMMMMIHCINKMQSVKH
jgi:hypothetical protein